MLNQPTYTGVYLGYVDYPTIFKHTTPTPEFINDLDNTTKESREALMDRIRTTCNGENMAIIPSCACGHLSGAYNRNRICDKCGGEVVSEAERPIRSELWIRCPKGIKTLINPTFWDIVTKEMTRKGFSFLEYIASTAYTPKKDAQGLIEQLKDLGIKRGGFNYLCDNFLWICKTIINHFTKEFAPQAKRKELIEYIEFSMDNVFTPYIPIPNKLVFITEKTPTLTYVDSKMTHGLDAILTFFGVDESDNGSSHTVIENRTVKGLTQLGNYYRLNHQYTLGKKEGAYRKHIFGSRVNYAARAVISSLSGAFRYDEVHIPWGVAIGIFKYEISNILLKQGWTPIDINRYLITHAKKFSTKLNNILKQLISNTPHPGRPCAMVRNPTLARGAIQALYITRVKTDVTDVTIDLNVKVTAPANADATKLGTIFTNCMLIAYRVSMNIRLILSSVLYQGDLIVVLP